MSREFVIHWAATARDAVVHKIFPGPPLEDPMQEYAEAERRLGIHLAGWKECDLGNDKCEHVQRRNAAYLAYTKKPHPSVRSHHG